MCEEERKKLRLYHGKLAKSLAHFSPVTQSCLTLCNHMEGGTPGLLAHHQLLEHAHTYVHRVSDAMHPSHSLYPLFLLPSIFPRIRVFFPVNHLFTSHGQSIGASTSASVLSMNIQDWSPLGLTGLISLSSRVSQGSSPTPQFKSINALALSFLYGPTLTFIHDYWKSHIHTRLLEKYKWYLSTTKVTHLSLYNS